MSFRVRVELTIQFDPQSESEIQAVSEQLAKGLTVKELTALWEVVDRAIREPAHLEMVRLAREG